MLFYPWISGYIGKELLIDPTLADIQHLNEMAKREHYDLIKVSFNCLGKILDRYDLLPCGAALGNNCGPKIIANEPLSLDGISGKRIAIPGEETTAHLLFDHFCSNLKCTKVFCLYDEISSLLKEDRADCGVIIHESRFTFQMQGFFEVADLGTLWYKKTNLPLPLGCLAVSKALPEKIKTQICSILRESYQLIQKNPKFSDEYVLAYAQEKNFDVIRQHIELYVTEETYALSDKGKKSIETLLGVV